MVQLLLVLLLLLVVVQLLLVLLLLLLVVQLLVVPHRLRVVVGIPNSNPMNRMLDSDGKRAHVPSARDFPSGASLVLFIVVVDLDLVY